MMNRFTPNDPPGKDAETLQGKPLRHPTLSTRLWPLGALLVALVVRLHALGAESLWYDETVSVVLARSPLPEMIAHTAGDIHPPGYYLMLHGWQALAQPSLQHGLEFLFAWPSLFFGVLIVALLYPVGRRLLDHQTALLATWIAALHPHHVWYSQEVRMYTMGALLGLLCLWLLLQYQAGTTRGRAVQALCAYALCAAVGLYTLYYFLFLLLALNVIALVLLWKDDAQRRASRAQRLGGWLAAQMGVLLLWVPWLPIFWRQATEPPVPVWRVPWRSARDVFAALSESARTLFMGESFPNAYGAIWLLLLGLLLIAYCGYTQRNGATHGGWIPVTLVFLPLVLITVASLVITPLYHVRYLYIYAPLFALVLATALRQIYARPANVWKAVALCAALFLVLGGGWSLYRFWTSPLYRADDHRTAVAELAREWRPGDAILVNAGWVYTVLDTYWPTEPSMAAGTPRGISAQPRLALYAGSNDTSFPDANAPFLVRSGSVDGPITLGWGERASDFYAISEADTRRAVTQMAAIYPRIWHYRLYDTVNDPSGVIRSTLAAEAEPVVDTGYAGRDFLRVQRFDTDASAPNFAPSHVDGVSFSEMVNLASHVAPVTATAGTMLYVDLHWSPGEQPLPAAGLQTSLRLYANSEADEPGTLWAQIDAPLLAVSETGGRTPLALPVPLSTAPGEYWLELVIYRADDGVPLALPAGERTVDGQRWRLQSVTVEPGDEVAIADPVLATFDYIALLAATPDRTAATPGDTVTMALLWYPDENEYRDTYDAVIELRTPDGVVVQSWVERAGSARYPSGDWLPRHPLRDVKTVPLSPELTPGRYTIALRLQRASDGQPIPARIGPLRRAESVEIGTLLLE